MKELLINISKGLVECPDEVSAEERKSDKDDTIIYNLHVAESDVGKVIGKNGNIARAIRTIMRSVAAKNNCKVLIKIN